MIRDYFRTRDASNPAKPWHEISCEDRFFFEGGSATGVSVREAIEHHSAMCCGTGGTRCDAAHHPHTPPGTTPGADDNMCMSHEGWNPAGWVAGDATMGTGANCLSISSKIRDHFRTRDARPTLQWHEISCEDRLPDEHGAELSVREAIMHHSTTCCGVSGSRCGMAPPAMPTPTGDSMCMHQTEFHAAKEIFVDTHGTKSSCQAQSDKVLNHFRSTRSDPALPWSSIGCEERFWVDEAGVEMSVREAISHRMECCGASGMRCGGAAAAPPATPGGMHDHMMCSEHEWRPAHHVLIDAKKKLVVKVRATI